MIAGVMEYLLEMGGARSLLEIEGFSRMQDVEVPSQFGNISSFYSVVVVEQTAGAQLGS